MKTRRFRRCLPLLAVLLAGPAMAVDDEGLFELDFNGPDAADTADNGFGDILLPNNPGDDWDNLYFDTDSAIQTTFAPTGLSGVLEEGGPILLDLTALQGADTVFTSGGSKDDNFIGSWKWKYAGPPDKNDIEHAFAAAYVNDDGELLIYMGADRFETNGDAQMGFWFLQDPEFGPIEGDPGGSGLGFNGEHVNGDILVQANFVNGGKVPVIQVYEWAEGLGDDGNTNLRRLGVTNGSFTQFGECDGSGDDACGLTNSDFITNAWPYISKDGDTDVPPQALFEVGINLTALLAEANGGEVPNLCFSAFVAETRASASFTAVLKDWVYGSFELCGLEVTKQCRDLVDDDPDNAQGTISDDGSTITLAYEGTVTNTGAVGYTVDLEDLVNGNGGTTGGDGITQVCIDGLNGNPKDGICQEDEDLGTSVINEGGTATFDLGGGQVALYQGEWTVTGSVTSLSFKDEISAIARIGEDPLFDEPSKAEATCVVVGSPDIAVTKSCTNADIEDETTFVADISGTVTNTGNVKLVNVTFSDVVTGAPLTGDYEILRADLSVFSDGDDLAPGETITFTGDVASTTFTSHANTITWTGANVFNTSETVSDEATAPGIQLDENGDPLLDENDNPIPEVCEFNATPSIQVVKNCTAEGVDLDLTDGVLGILVNTSLTVTNNGSDEKLTFVKLTDPEGGLVSSDDKFDCNEAGTECNAKSDLSVGESATFTQQYRPNGISVSNSSDIIGILTDPSSISFYNKANVEGTGVLSGGLTLDDDDADCPLCECEDCSEEPQPDA